MQAETEQILEDIATELGVAVQWSTTVTGFRQDTAGVDVIVDTPHGSATLRGSYLVACDGGRSTIRKLTGVGFPGTDATMACLTGEVELDDPPERPLFLQRRERGFITVIQFRPGWHRVVTCEPHRAAGPDDPVSLEELRASVRRIAGTDFGIRSPRWLSHFNDAVRQAERYRVGRVLLAGDAGHIHLPAGGQGMNIGMQDAFNLGWKLAAVVRGEATDALLDIITLATRCRCRHSEPGPCSGSIVRAERTNHPAVQRLSPSHRLQRGEHLSERQTVGARHLLPRLRRPSTAGSSRPRCRDQHQQWDNHDLPAPAPSHTCTAEFFRHAATSEAATAWAGRVTPVSATTAAGPWTLPDATTIPAPAALLIRPDGYVAWISDGATDLGAARDPHHLVWSG